MKILSTIILFSLLYFLGYSQGGPGPGYDPIKAEGFAISDADGNIVGAEDGGVLVMIRVVDTASTVLVQAPDTIQTSYTNVANPGDTSGLSNGIQAYWSFEETSGSIAFDSAASYDGTLTNGVTQSATGISNLCYLYDYSDAEYIDFGTSFWDVGLNDLTVSLWTQVINDGQNGGLIGNYGSTPYWWLRVSYGGTVIGHVNFGGGSIDTWSNIHMPENTWYHVVFQLDRDVTTAIYLNNVLQADQDDISAYSATNLANSNTFAIGRPGNNIGAGYYHDGLIDEVAIYDRLLSEEEISNLYNQGVGKFWPHGGAGGDSIRIRNIDFDERADSVRIITNPLGEGRSTSRTDGILLGAFNMVDSIDWNDTTMAWPYLKDTTYIIETYTGLWPEDIWTDPPNYDTVFIDSSHITPQIQDPGGEWDTLFYQDFEHQDAPIYYTSGQNGTPGPNLFSPDWNGTTWRNSDYAYPTWWRENRIPDSIIIDPQTGSKAVKFSMLDDVVNGICSDNSFRGGDSWTTYLDDPEPKEMYFSYNVMFKPGFEFARGGKLPGISGGTYFVEGDGSPGYGYGFNANGTFYHTPQGSMSWYCYYQDQTTYPYGQVRRWKEFTPEGENLNYELTPQGDLCFVFDVTGYTWYNITMRVVCNTFSGETPIKNGILEGYINGKLLDRWSGLYLLTYPDINEGVRMFVRAFIGGGACPLRDEWILIDDFICFTYDESVDVPRGNEISSPGRVLNLPNWPKVD